MERKHFVRTLKNTGKLLRCDRLPVCRIFLILKKFENYFYCWLSVNQGNFFEDLLPPFFLHWCWRTHVGVM